MPTSAPKFSQKIRPFSDEFNRDMQQMAEAVRRMEAAFDIVYKKALEPGTPVRPSAVSGLKLMLITSSTADLTGSTPSWKYTAKLVDGYSSGSFTASGSTTYRLRNLAEDQTHYEHDEDLTPSGVSGATLTPRAATGPVLAYQTALLDDDDEPIWVFELMVADPGCGV